MTSKAPDIRTYLNEVPPARRAILERLRSLCQQQLKDYEECMEYGMPGYKRRGILEVSFASQKQYIALYILKKQVVEEFRGALPDASIGKGCIRFTKPEKINFEILQRLLRYNAESEGAPC